MGRTERDVEELEELLEEKDRRIDELEELLEGKDPRIEEFLPFLQKRAKENAEVEMHYANGGQVEVRARGKNLWGRAATPVWNWEERAYRKKEEIVYEWQWLVKTPSNPQWVATNYYRSLEEFKLSRITLDYTEHKFIKIEESQREVKK